MVYKSGGFYSDLDSVTVKALSPLKNVIGSTTRDDTAAKHLANGVFQLSKHHPVLKKLMEKMVTVYTGRSFNEIGPLLLTSTVMEQYNISDVENFKGGELEVLKPEVFFPAKSYELNKLWRQEPTSLSEWRSWLSQTSMVHFYSSQTNKLLVQRDGQHEAIAVLGPEYCPLSYQSSLWF